MGPSPPINSLQNLLIQGTNQTSAVMEVSAISCDGAVHAGSNSDEEIESCAPATGRAQCGNLLSARRTWLLVHFMPGFCLFHIERLVA